MDDLFPVLTSLEAERKTVMDRLDAITAKIDDEKRRIIKERFGVYIGGSVWSEGKEFQVSIIDLRYVDVRGTQLPWVEGYPRKKDGTFSASRRHIYRTWSLTPPQNE